MKLKVYFISLVWLCLSLQITKASDSTEVINLPEDHIAIQIDAIALGDGLAEDVHLDDEAPSVGDLQLTPIKDPAEPFNRVMFAFNDKVYIYVVSPFGKLYRKIIPRFVRKGISNFGANLKTPVNLLNSVLQLKLKKSGRELTRFTINSTIGLLGFFDVATKLGIKEPNHENFSQTLAFYGVPHGMYIVAPFKGPMSIRDGVGFLADLLVMLVTLSPVATETELFATQGVTHTDDAINLVRDYRSITDDTFDKYPKIRDLYLRFREGNDLD